MTPYFLMFGCEPKLPVDFLLGNATRPGEEAPEAWVQEHQERLQVAYAQVRERIQERVSRRDQRHSPRVNDKGFKEGELVYLKNHSSLGRNKIQDVWSPCLYKVTSAPEDQGVVYSVAPVSQESPVKQVHRTEMRAALLPLEVDTSPVRDGKPSTPEPGQEDGEESPVVLLGPMDDCHSLSPSQESFLEVDADQHSEEESVQPFKGEPVLRRSRRGTAGQHSNPFRLPVSVVPTVGEELGRIGDE